MRSARGISLLELLISMTIGLLLLMVVSGLLVSLLGEQSRERRQAQLGAMMDASLSLIAMDLRRAGFWNGSGAEEDNPYRELFIERDGSCLLYGYDNPATPSATSKHRYFAFRLERQRIQRRSSDQADWNCSASGGWDDLSKPDIGVVDTLRFRPAANGGAIDIAVSAQTANGAEEEKLNIHTSVTLRNQPKVAER